MSRPSLLILLGILIILTPFSGFPIATRSLFSVVFGAIVSSIGLSVRAHEIKNATQHAPESPLSVSRSAHIVAESVEPHDISLT